MNPLARRLLPLLALCASAASAFAQSAPPPPGAAPVRRVVTIPDGAAPPGAAVHPMSGALTPPRALAFAGDRVEVPINLYENRPVVDAFVNGKGPFRLGIETGAAFAAFTQSTLDSLHLKPLRSDEMGGIEAVDSIVVGGLAIRGLEVRDAAPADRTIDGFLGLGVFEQVLMTVDYPARKLVLEHGALPKPDGATILDTRRVGPFYAVELDVAGRPTTAVIDTRGSSAFGFTPEVGDSLRFQSPPAVVGQARGAAIPLVDVKLGRLAGDIRLGATRFERPLVSVRPLPPGFPGGILGSNALVEFAFTLDQASNRVRFVRTTGGPVPAPPPVTDLGLRLKQRPGSAPEVGEVRPGTPADSVGVKVGDVILEAGGIDGASIDPPHWRAMASAGKPVSMKFRRGEITMARTVAPAVLVP